MYVNNSNEYIKHFDSIAKYTNKVISVFVNYRESPVKGKLINVTKDFIELERFSGDVTTIRRRVILAINNAKEAKQVI